MKTPAREAAKFSQPRLKTKKRGRPTKAEIKKRLERLYKSALRYEHKIMSGYIDSPRKIKWRMPYAKKKTDIISDVAMQELRRAGAYSLAVLRKAQTYQEGIQKALRKKISDILTLVQRQSIGLIWILVLLFKH